MLFRSNSRREVTKEPLQVAVRLRPLAGVAAETGYAWSIERRPDGQQWVCHQGTPESKGSFTFDHCFDDRTSNRELFDATAKKLVQSAVDGSNASILAYGQTSSGKTHSILGTPYEPGILPLAVEEIFGFQEDGLRAVGKQASVSYYEIFNEKVTDLLATNPVSTSLPVKESAGYGFFVQGLREAPVYSNEDVLCLVARGEERRRYARTRWNDYSSRSHVIFTLSFATRGAIEVSAARSKLNIVDLAGCENHKHEASEDGRHINRSLFFLGEVISKLCKDGHGRLSWSPARRSPSSPSLRKEVASPSPRSRELSRSGGLGATWSAALRSADHSRPRSPSRPQRGDFIPYRDSKLTRVLRSSLGGDARTLLLVTVHPAASFAEQSLTSLRFATKARSVDNYIPGAASEVPSNSGHGILATASEDTLLRVLHVSGTTEAGPCTLSPAAATVRFPGAVRALCSLPLPAFTGAATGPSALLVSGGAKGALKAHLLQGDALLGVWCTSLGLVDPVRIQEADSTSDSDENEPGDAGEPSNSASTGRLEGRVMALSCVELQRSEARHDVLLACASSSGFLRTWQLQIFPQQKKAEVTFLERSQVFNTTALCMECFTAPKFQGVFAGSAAGTLAVLQLQGPQGPTGPRPLCEELQVHQAGVNDLALRQLEGPEGPRVAALTAGDDHGVGLCLYALEDDAMRLIGRRLIESAHFSAVRSVAWTATGDVALSLGLDRRLRLWRVQLEEQALELKAERIASCTEPESMAAWPLQKQTLVALAGRGVELCLVDTVDTSPPG